MPTRFFAIEHIEELGLTLFRIYDFVLLCVLCGKIKFEIGNLK